VENPATVEKRNPVGIALFTEQYGVNSVPLPLWYIFGGSRGSSTCLFVLVLTSPPRASATKLERQRSTLPWRGYPEDVRLPQCNAESKRSAGWIFEVHTHIVFQSGGRFEAAKLGRSTAITIKIGNKPYRVSSNVPELGSLFRKQSRSQSIDPDIIGIYLKPQGSNLLGGLVCHHIHRKQRTSAVVLPNESECIPPCLGIGACECLGGNTCETQANPHSRFSIPVDVARMFSGQSTAPSDRNTSDSNSPNFDKWDQFFLFLVYSLLAYDPPRSW